MDQLRESVGSGKLDEVRGFGEAMKTSILKGIEEVKSRIGRFRIIDADHSVQSALGFSEKRQRNQSLWNQRAVIDAVVRRSETSTFLRQLLEILTS